MNTTLVNSAAGVINAALTQNRTAAGIALALDSAQLLLSPQKAADLAAYEALNIDAPEDRALLCCAREPHPSWLADTAAPTDADRACPWCRIAELEQLLAEKDRPVDEDPIRYTLTDKTCGADLGPGYRCQRPAGHGGDCEPTPDVGDVTPQVRKLRNLLAGQREQVGGES